MALDSLRSEENVLLYFIAHFMGFHTVSHFLPDTLYCSVNQREEDFRLQYFIVYREFSSLAKDLGYSENALRYAATHRNEHYHKISVPKGNGELRELHAPDPFLKGIQRKIAQKLLPFYPLSYHATAYRFGGGIRNNAFHHIGQPAILKMDIRKFFDHVTYGLIRDKVFPAEQYSEFNSKLLTRLCMYNDALPQGAPTSPAISNLILLDFDRTVSAWCMERRIAYTRYCDDLTFSHNLTPETVKELKGLVKRELGKLGFYLNSKKTIVVRQGQRMVVTGIVVNKKYNVSADYRRKLRQELYYCRKFGIGEHVRRKGLPFTEVQYARRLLGRVNYVLYIAKDNKEMSEYKTWLIQWLKDHRGEA